MNLTYKLLTKPKLPAFASLQVSPSSPFTQIEIPDFQPVWMDKVVFIVHREWNFGSWGKGYGVSCPITGGSLLRGEASPSKEEEIKQLYFHFNHNKWCFKAVADKCRAVDIGRTPNAQEWMDYEKRQNFIVEQGL